VSFAAASEDNAMRERRCIATQDVLSERALLRFVADPDGVVVADIEASLPGRGLWVKADRNAVAAAVARNLFSKAAKAPLRAPADLVGRVEALLVRRMQADIGLARRAGLIALGFDNVMRALDHRVPPAVLIEAAEGAAEGRRKIFAATMAKGLKIETIDALSSAELSLALGRENVIHAALKPGRLAERLIFDAGRLGGFRPASSARTSAGSTPAPNERRA
jgi:predicted RNA-binding protein YlxR (DUF448 family)